MTTPRVVLVPALIAMFGVLFVGLGVVYDWKTVIAVLITCPVGVAILIMSRNEANPIDRIRAADAKSALAREAKSPATNTAELPAMARAA